jgi:acetyltransferase-like isoleucine patch superfamily enzyme
VRSGARLWIEEGARLVLQGSSVLYSGALVHIQRGETATLGDGVSIQEGAMLLGDFSVGSQTLIAPRVFLSSGTHVFDRNPNMSIREQEREFGVTSRPVRIGDSCWIGVGSVLLPGVHLGGLVVVGANSVVTKSFDGSRVIAGVPAETLRTLSAGRQLPDDSNQNWTETS